MNSIGSFAETWLLLANASTNSPTPDKSLAVWAIILVGVAVVLFFLEVMVPSGGVIGVLSAVSLIAGVVMLFRINTTLGLIGAILSLAAVPFLFAFALKLWPTTPIAQMLLLKNLPRDGIDRAEPAPNDLPNEPLVGACGQALTDLRPVGTCLIDGRRQPCLAESNLISRGSKIRVVSVDGMGVKVRLDT